MHCKVIAAWHSVLTSNRLKLNADKTDFILLETREQLDKVNLTSIDLDGVKIAVSKKVKCLGFTVDGEPTFAALIKCLAGRCFYQLRQLRTVRRSLSVEAGRTLVHAFVISRVDYCNSVFGSTCVTHLKPDCKEAVVRPHHGLFPWRTALAAFPLQVHLPALLVRLQ